MMQCTMQKTTHFVSTENNSVDELIDWLKILSRFNYPIAQASACTHLSPGDDCLLISGKLRFSNPCKYVPMPAADPTRGPDNFYLPYFLNVFSTHRTSNNTDGVHTFHALLIWRCLRAQVLVLYPSKLLRNLCMGHNIESYCYMPAKFMLINAHNNSIFMRRNVV